LLQTVDVSTLLADFGFAQRTALISELTDRLRRKILPGTPETIDSAELFAPVAPSRFDAEKLAAIPLIGALNLSVSFYCAFRLALQAHKVSGVDRARINRAYGYAGDALRVAFLLPASEVLISIKAYLSGHF